MVDFRYHLVSLISVFLALAVGVVLGAGPLQEPIANGLTNQVETLRESQARTSEEIERVRADVSHRNAWIEEVAHQVLPTTLENRTFAIVTLPDTAKEDVKAIKDYVEMAGGKVNQQASLTDAWASEDFSQYRESLAGPVATHLGKDMSDVDAASAILSQAVLEMLTADTENTKLLREMFTDSETALVTFEQEQDVSETLIFVGPPAVAQSKSGDGEADMSDPAEVTAVDSTMWLAFARIVSSTPRPGIVVGDASNADSLVAQIREESIPVNTVDSVATSIGHANAVIALLSADMSTRSFGLASSATDLVPPLPGVSR